MEFGYQETERNIHSENCVHLLTDTHLPIDSKTVGQSDKPSPAEPAYALPL